VPVTALLLTPPVSPPPACAIAVVAPVINNDATPRIRIVFVMDLFVIKLLPSAGRPTHDNAERDGGVTTIRLSAPGQHDAPDWPASARCNFWWGSGPRPGDGGEKLDELRPLFSSVAVSQETGAALQFLNQKENFCKHLAVGDTEGDFAHMLRFGT
jgi:hypothetical protein